MDPITLVLGLASAVPSLIKLFGGSDDHAAVASRVIDVAKQVTGQADPGSAIAQIKSDPALLAEMNRHIEAMATTAAAQTKAEEDAATAQMQALTDRIAQLEGTASDLKSVPVLGSFMLFLRGAARPLIEYAVMYLDYMVFSAAWHLPEGAITNCFWLINGVVLSFLFGERAIKNVAPFVSDMLAARRS